MLAINRLSRLWAASCFAIVALVESTFAQSVDRVVAAHYPPLMIDAAHERPGFAIEVLQAAAKRIGREIDVTFLPFERAKHTLLAEPSSLMPALFKGKNNDDAFHWVAEIGQAHLRFASLSKPIDSFDEARAVSTIVVETGTTGDALLTQMNFKNIIRVTGPTASASMLAAKRADAWFLSERLMRKTWGDLGVSDPLVMGKIVHTTPIFLVASPTLPKALSDAYRNAIQSMRDDGVFQTLADRYDFPTRAD